MRKMIRHFCDFIFGKHRNNTLPRVWILAVDLFIVLFAYIAAVLLYFAKDLAHLSINWKFIWIYPLPYLVAFLISRTYDGMLRYSGFNDGAVAAQQADVARLRRRRAAGHHRRQPAEEKALLTLETLRREGHIHVAVCLEEI